MKLYEAAPAILLDSPARTFQVVPAMSRRIITPALFLAAAAACGSSAKPTTPLKDLAWKDMNAEQRHAYMEKVVMPKAKAVFAAFDPKYQTMDCKTCHGPGAEDGSFEMPNPKLRPLPNTPEAFIALMGKDAEVQRFTPFMAGKVEPMMGELLHMTVFDPKTKTGELSCENCHTLVDETGKIVAPQMGGHEHHDHADHAH